ncbi:MAG: DNA polymerase I [Candidatus Cloacimonetes bacterium]|nr:DNA polymerase I [Candidatus Cloacimonadota bacterium]MCK9178476.1 DNA polymerase I [Candidatus Cloacimonadota bacterium]
MKDKLFLIDGTALFYRAHFAFIRNPLINSRQENTSAIFGVINSFLTLIDKMDAKYIAIAFDRKAPTFRHKEYKEYKANRPPMPEDLSAQLPAVLEFFDLLKIPEIGADGYEADDALGTMGELFKKDFDIVYVTSDKDYCQLIEEGSGIYDPMKDNFMDSKAVYEKYGVHPEQFIDYLALMGDSSDNIPGVRGIGQVSAQKLLKEHKSLEDIYQHIDDVDKKYKSKLIENKDNAFLSQHLARIVLDAELVVPARDELFFEPERLSKALPFMKRYELRTLQRRIETKFLNENWEVDASEQQADIFESAEAPKEALPTREKSEFEAILVGKDRFTTLIKELEKADKISLDTETDSLDWTNAALVGISLCWEPTKAYYLPLGHQMTENLDMKETIQALSKACRGKTIIAHNLKFDRMILKRHGWLISEPFFDTMIAAYVLDAGYFTFSLDDCAARELGYRMMPITELIGKGRKQITFDLVSVQDACFYAAEDAWATLSLFRVYQGRLESSRAKKVFYELDLPLMPVLMQMEELGVSIDEKVLSKISHQLNIEIKQLTEEIYEISGYEFNLNSTQQLAKLLFEELKLPAKKKTKSGYSTDNSVLEALSEDYEIASRIIEYRQLVKLQNTYVSALPRLVNPDTQRIHSSFNQCVASTGRLSSTNPNLQNIPIRTKTGREIRKAFVPGADDFLVMAADYSQIELRLLALMSEDEKLLEAFEHKIDIHKQTAAQINGVAISEVSADMRRAAKTINFGLMYGMGQRKLARELNISQSEAKTMIENYFAQFPAISNFKAECIAKARSTGRAETIFGRVLDLPGIHSKNKGTSSEAERIAVNMPIQGSAADIIKRAMLGIHARIQSEPKIRMIMQVHDELVFEVHKDYAQAAQKLVREEMEAALPKQYRQKIRLSVDIGIGKNWYEAH